MSSSSDVWDYVRESSDRCRHVSTGERLYSVVDRGIEKGRPKTGNALAKLNYEQMLKEKEDAEDDDDGVRRNSRVRSLRRTLNKQEYMQQRTFSMLRTFSSPNFHNHMMSKGRKLPLGDTKSSPTTYRKFPPPYQKSFLPARIASTEHTLKRSKSHFYSHKVQQVEHRVAKLAKALGMDVTPHEQENIDLSPSKFTGFVPTTDKKKWTRERFQTYFNQDGGQQLLYGGDYGLETLGGSWMGVDKKGRVASRQLEGQEVEEKVTFRFLNFDNLLAYQPLVYGKPVWVVVISGLGDFTPKGWMTGCFLGAKVQVSFPFCRVHQLAPSVDRHSLTHRPHPSFVEKCSTTHLRTGA